MVMLKFVIDGTLKKLGHERGRGDQRPLRRSLFTGPRLHPGGTREGAGADAGDLRHLRREGGGGPQHDAAADRRDRAGTGMDRRAGQADSGWSTNSAGSSARSRSPSSARRLSPDSEVEIVVYPGKKSFYDIVGTRSAPAERASALAVLLGFRDPRPLQSLTAPLRVFRSGEPLAMMPNVFIR